ncbi:hypothetical protein AYJ59_11525 [Thiomicrospira sp. S5]|nr:hypothetical protein AYJ59_11525 [Thiomicrospira sp. S5]
MIGENDKYKVNKTLSKLRKFSSSSDFISSVSVLRSSDLFQDNGIYRDFSNRFLRQTEAVNKGVYFPVEMILRGINHNKKELLKALDEYRALFVLIQREDMSNAIKLVDSLIEKKYLSLTLVKVLFFIKNNIDDKENKSKASQVDEILTKTEIGNISYLENAIRELINPRTEYLNIHQRITDHVSEYSTSMVAKSFIYPVPKTRNIFEKTVSGYYELSLLDSFFYAVRVFQSIPTMFDDYSVQLDSSLIEAYLKLSGIRVSDFTILSTHNEIPNFFKESFLLMELDECFEYRTVHCALYNKNQNKFSEIGSFESALLNGYFKEIENLKDLSFVENSTANIKKFNSKGCCLLENSTALVYVLNKLNGDITGQEYEFVRLMSFTKNIGLICPQSYLIKITSNAISDELRLVSSCLSVISDKNDISEHDLRSTIEEIAETKGEDLLGLIQRLYAISPSVSEHLIQVCDQNFISTLFELTEKPIKATETRINILEWYGNETGDDLSIERARNLRVELQISKHRDTIDDSRIYADPFKFTQWVTDNVLDEIILILEKADSAKILASFNKVDWSAVGTSLNHVEQIGYHLLRSYNEFCENKLFGVSSYLGRRIRHGTFKGTALKEVKDIADNPKYLELFKCRDFEIKFYDWLGEYEGMLNRLKKEYLHINDKAHKNGLIFPGLDTHSKLTSANNMYREVCTAYYNNENVTNIPYLILDFCWRFIEEDLTKIKSFLDEQKSRNGHFCYDLKSFNGETRKLSYDFKQEVNSITADKFRTISSWFNKPSYATLSVKTDLLFNAVIEEVKESVVGFNPTIVLKGNLYYLNGVDSFVVYDALFILISNAAENGKRGGTIQLVTDENREGQCIKITIVSEVDSDADLAKAKGEIESKMASSDDSEFQDAHIVESGSGIKKLKLLEKAGDIGNVEYGFDQSNRTISASFDFYVSYVS